MNRSIVIKIGGSILYNDDLKPNKPVMDLIKSWYVKNDASFENIVLVTGGGKLARSIMGSVSEYLSNEKDKHSIAMEMTQTSSQILRGVLSDPKIYVPQTLSQAYEYLSEKGPKRMVSGGLKVGWSTDMDAVVFADMLNIKEVFKLSNVDHIYTADPKVDPKAVAIEKISWEQYMIQFGIDDTDVHGAGQNIPISAECARFCQSKGISFYFSGGSNLEKGMEFEVLLKSGTLIHP